MIEVAMIPNEGVDKIWPKAEPLIAKSLAYMPGRYETVDFYADILSGAKALWIAFESDTSEIKAAWMTSIRKLPLSTVLSVEWLGGDDLEGWADKAFEVMEDYGRTTKCNRIEAIGRAGWSLHAKKHGMEKCAVVYDKEL